MTIQQYGDGNEVVTLADGSILVSTDNGVTSSNSWLIAYEPPSAWTLTVANVKFDLTSSAPIPSATLDSGDSSLVLESDNVVLIPHYNLAVPNTKFDLKSDGADLIQHFTVTVGNSGLVVSSGSPTLAIAGIIPVEPSAFVVKSSEPDLIQHYVLSIGNSSLVTKSSEPILEAHESLQSVGGTVFVVTSGPPSLIQKSTLVVGNSVINFNLNDVWLITGEILPVDTFKAQAVAFESTVNPTSRSFEASKSTFVFIIQA